MLSIPRVVQMFCGHLSAAADHDELSLPEVPQENSHWRREQVSPPSELHTTASGKAGCKARGLRILLGCFLGLYSE
jgi:hypothetical protein